WGARQLDRQRGNRGEGRVEQRRRAPGLPKHPCHGTPGLDRVGNDAERDVVQRPAMSPDAMVIEAGLSRVYGGIHYRFDIEAGQELVRSVARFTIAADRSGRSVLTQDNEEEEEGDGPN